MYVTKTAVLVVNCLFLRCHDKRKRDRIYYQMSIALFLTYSHPQSFGSGMRLHRTSSLSRSWWSSDWNVMCFFLLFFCARLLTVCSSCICLLRFAHSTHYIYVNSQIYCNYSLIGQGFFSRTSRLKTIPSSYKCLQTPRCNISHLGSRFYNLPSLNWPAT